VSVVVYTNGINCLSHLNTEYNRNKIVFVGNMRTLQNQDAALFFVNDVFPLVKKAIPVAVFHIIGAEPPSVIQNLADGRNIIVSGFVQSVEEAIKDAACSVAPVRIAAGIQNKALISMACGVPVVLTSLIAKGIPGLADGVNCLVSDDKEAFAHSVVALLRDQELRNSIGRAGYHLMQTRYSWNKTLKGYEELV